MGYRWGKSAKWGPIKKNELNISSERAFSKLPENKNIIEIGRMVHKLLSFKELLSTLVIFPTGPVLITTFEYS